MPAYQIIVSPTALQDVQQIWDYIALQNADAATRVTDEIWLGFHHLGRFPNSGDVRTDLAGDRPLRFWRAGSYFVVYRTTESTVEIAGVLHGSRDIPAVLRDRDDDVRD